MSKTPGRHTRQRSAATTLGSIASARSNRSVKSTDTDRGVPFILKVQLAQDIEDQFPLASGGIKNLYEGAGQPLCSFLDARDEFHGEPLYGKRGDDLHGKIGDLCQRWKAKACEHCDQDMLQKCQTQRKTAPKQATRKRDTSDSEADASSLSSQEDKDFIPAPPPL